MDNTLYEYSCVHLVISIYSAAKAPYLARFRVQKLGINELEAIALAISTQNNGPAINSQEQITKILSSGLGQEMWQAAIFKVM